MWVLNFYNIRDLTRANILKVRNLFVYLEHHILNISPCLPSAQELRLSECFYSKKKKKMFKMSGRGYLRSLH